MTESKDPVNQESNIAANVLDINNKPVRRTRPPKPVDPNAPAPEPKPKKPSPAILYEAIFGAITKMPTNILPEFPADISVVEFRRGHKVEIEVGSEGVCSIVLPPVIKDSIMDYTRSLRVFQPNYDFDDERCNAAAKYWKSASKSIQNPPFIRFKSDPGLCWARLPFDLSDERIPTPLFDNFVSRIKFNRNAIMAWIGSIFIQDSYDQQYLWLHGEGNDGKSTLFTLLEELLGNAALSVSHPPGDDRHWALDWLNKRFAFIPDLRELSSIRSGPWMQMTGGDKVTVRPFFSQGYAMRFPVKLAIGSQKYPDSELQKADKRRLIYGDIEPSTATRLSLKYKHDCAKEFPSFIAQCIDKFHELCPDPRMAIPVEEDSYQGLEERRDRLDVEDFQLWFDFYFEIAINGYCLANEIADAIRLQFGLKEESRKGAYRFLERKGFSGKQSPNFIEGKRPTIYKGIRRKKILNSDPNSVPRQS